MFKMILGVLVWKKLITIKMAKRLYDKLGTTTIPYRIEDVINELEDASHLD
jgi:hypothetical protein